MSAPPPPPPSSDLPLGQEEGEYEIQGPLVFSCGKCKAIIGDSFSLTSTNENLKTITLSGVNNLTLEDDDLITSRGVGDKGSTYHHLKCSDCRETIGKYYVSTPRILDGLREQYTLLTDMISSYELGRVGMGIAGPVLPPPPIPQAEQAMVNELDDEVSKVQHVVMDLVYRISELEKANAALASSSNRVMPLEDGGDSSVDTNLNTHLLGTAGPTQQGVSRSHQHRPQHVQSSHSGHHSYSQQQPPSSLQQSQRIPPSPQQHSGYPPQHYSQDPNKRQRNGTDQVVVDNPIIKRPRAFNN